MPVFSGIATCSENVCVFLNAITYNRREAYFWRGTQWVISSEHFEVEKKIKPKSELMQTIAQNTHM